MACKGNCKCKCKRAIITGITGQDGSHLADFLLNKDYEVIGITRRSSTNNNERINHILNHPKFKLVDGDITDYSSITNVLLKYNPTEFYNLAAQSHVAISFQQPTLTWDVTAKGCLNILQAIIDLGLNDKVKFYQASSSEMFGKNYDLINGVKVQNEKTKFLPQSPYAIAKCAAHEAVRLYREAYGLHASAGILFNHEGPRRGKDFVTRKITRWIAKFFRFLKRNNIETKHLTKFSLDKDCDLLFASGIQESFPKLRLGNLDVYRDWGYAGDYVEAMWMMIQKATPDDYVICTGETHTIREFLDSAFEHIGITDWSGLVVQDREFYRPAEVNYLKGDSTKAKESLGWTPKISFKQLVNIMMENDLKNDL
jgi:GDPmannose 4,6-dehydratase